MASATAQPEPARLLPEVLAPRDLEDRRSRSRRDWLVDVACFLFALVAGAALYSNQVRIEDPPAWQQVAGVAFGLAACTALWVRRRSPVGVAVAILPVAAFSSFAAPAGLIAFFTVAVYRRFVVVAMVGGLGLGTLAVSYAVIAGERPELQTSYWLSLLSIVLLHIAIAAAGMYVRARRQLLRSLRERAERAVAEQQWHVERAREQERARIAREMHDVLAHRISLLSMHAGSLEFRPEASPDQIARAAGIVRASAHQALQDLREVIGVLRQGPGEAASARPQPTLADLPALVRESGEAGMTVRATLDIDAAGSAPPAVGRNAYRIVQEGLTNARKHAHGVTVTLAVTGGPGSGLTIELRNPLPVGRGAAEIPGAGTGLIGLAERVGLAGGRLEHGQAATGDFRLWAWLPWPA
jgi:signal transduction histidine kinase